MKASLKVCVSPGEPFASFLRKHFFVQSLRPASQVFELSSPQALLLPQQLQTDPDKYQKERGEVVALKKN